MPKRGSSLSNQRSTRPSRPRGGSHAGRTFCEYSSLSELSPMACLGLFARGFGFATTGDQPSCPVAGTPVMAASPLAALDLPLEVLIWADGEKTMVSYYDTGVRAARHNLSADLAEGLAGIDALTGALVAS